MRDLRPARLALLVFALLLQASCANRGMHPPTDAGGAGLAGTGGKGGAAGNGGTGGAAGRDAGCYGPNPNTVDAGPCSALFNFVMQLIVLIAATLMVGAPP